MKFKVHAGQDVDGAPIYVGRAYHDGDQVPAKVIPSKNVAYIPYGGTEIPKHQFDVSIVNKILFFLKVCKILIAFATVFMRYRVYLGNKCKWARTLERSLCWYNR